MDESSAWDAVAGFLTTVALEKGLTVNSREAYRNDLRDLIRYCGDHDIARLQDIQTADILDYLGELYNLGVASSTMSRRLSAFRGFFSYLNREGIIEKNPAELVDGPRIKRKLPEVLTVHEIESLLAQPSEETNGGIRDRAIFELMYGCGLRVSEVVNLKLDNILLDGELLKVTGKGSKQRIVPIGDYARKALYDYLTKSRPSLVRDPQKAREGLFLSLKLGRPMSRQAIWLMLKDYARSAGLSGKITPHTLRHSFATHLIEGGAGLREVQELLGHVSIDTTTIYTHIDRTHLLEVIRTCHPREK